MVAGFRSPRDFSREAENRHPNTALFPENTLIRVATGGSGEFRHFEQAEALGELAARFFLWPKADSPCMRALATGLGEDRFRAFCDWCESALIKTPDTDSLVALLDDAKGGSAAECVCKKIRDLVAADGMIPVFDGEGDAYLLPFRFTSEVATASSPKAFDADDRPISKWTEELRHLPVQVGCNIHVGIALSEDHPFELDGGSLLLPVLAAWWRREKAIPRYDPLRVFFTGSFRGGRLERVEVEEKRKKIKDSIKNGILVYPILENGDPSKNAIRVGGDSEAVLGAVRDIAERFADFDTEYALNRLVAYEANVRQTRTTDWDGVLSQLDHLRAGLDPDLDAAEYLHAVLLTAAANCHAGRTAAAAEWNGKARLLATGDASAEPMLLRARIEQLVIFQDTEDFHAIFDLVPDLEARIDAFCKAEGGGVCATDLKMRFHGSMGQSLTYANIAGFRPDASTPDAARRHLETAFNCAKELYGMARSSDDRTLRAADVAQDANYLLLWAAFFDRLNLDSCLSRALRLASRSGEAAAKNERFAHRYYALGLYRAVLAGDSLPMLDLVKDSKALERQWQEDWIAGTMAKYLGAVAAANGDQDEAARLFDVAAKAIDEGAHEIIGVIRMTIFAEAFRSLRRFPELAARAGECRAEALRFFDSGDPAADTKTAWKDWLENPGAAPFPGLSYWY